MRGALDGHPDPDTDLADAKRGDGMRSLVVSMVEIRKKWPTVHVEMRWLDGI